MAEQRMSTASTDEQRKMAVINFAQRARVAIERGDIDSSQLEKQAALKEVRAQVAVLCSTYSVYLSPAVTQSLLPHLENGTPANTTSRETSEVVPKSGRRESFQVMGSSPATYHNFRQSFGTVSR
jgi:hypothetical protein